MPTRSQVRPDLRNPSVIDPRIGTALRQFREITARTSGDNVAAALKWSPSKISRYERSRTAISRRGLAQILRFYQERYRMPLAQAEAIMTMFEQALTMGRFSHPFLGPAVMAASVQTWAPCYVPRLLQVRSYAAALLRDMQHATGMAPSETRDVLAMIAMWQTRLTGDPPVRIQAVLDESVLYRQCGTPEVMAAQLEHLGNAGDAVRVLPASGVPAPRWIPGFSYLEYPVIPGAEPAAEVTTEELDGPDQVLLSERDIWRRQQLFAALWGAAEPAGQYIKMALGEVQS